MTRIAAIADWEISHRELAEAEIQVLRWQLERGEQAVPIELSDRVAALRDRTNFLFETAAAILGEPFVTTVPGALDPT